MIYVNNDASFELFKEDGLAEVDVEEIDSVKIFSTSNTFQQVWQN
jgi:hypothetical protein